MTTNAPIGLITSLPNEFAEFADHLQVVSSETIAGQTFQHAALDGKPVIAVEAGIGKVNAAVTATLLCQQFGCRVLIFSGVAGGLDPALKPGDVVIGERLVMHDYGALIDGEIQPYQPGTPPLPGIDDTHGYTLPAPRLRAIGEALADVQLPPLSDEATGGQAHAPHVVQGTILTGDTFMNCPHTRDKLHSRYRAQAVEMEGAAIAQVAERFGAEALIVRCLSDLAGADSAVSFTALLDETSRIAATLVRRIVPLYA